MKINFKARKYVLNASLYKEKTQLILLEIKDDEISGGSFVDFITVIDPSYIITALKTANDDLGKNQKNSGIDFVSAVMKGKINYFWP